MDSMPPSSPTRESLSYALGELSATIQGHSKAIDEVPQRVVAVLVPRLESLETTAKDHSKRLGALEKTRWLHEGGRIVLVSLVASVVPLASLFGVAHR